MSTGSKNSLISIAADKGAANMIRHIFYPPGQKELKISLQCTNGWVTFDPDPNRGFVITHSPKPKNQTGRWLRGRLSEGASNNDVKIARALVGHRFWMVAHWRVWLYRFIAFAAVMYGSTYINEDLPYSWFAVVVGLGLMSIPSPCTPRGMMQWLDAMEWDENKLAANKNADANPIEQIRQQIAEDSEDND